MNRHRVVAAAPARDVSETWSVIADLISAALSTSSTISTNDVTATLAAAGPAVKLLIAGAHLDTHPLVVVAPPVHLSITTISGTKALEQVGLPAAVPGAASAQTFTLYLPTPVPLTDTIIQIARANSHLSIEKPPDSVETARTADEPAIDRDALRRMLEP